MTTTYAQEGAIPQWTLGDRLRKARQRTGLNTREFADEIGVSQVTVTKAENDKNKVRQITINAWSLATGVSREWLETGQGSAGPDDDGNGQVPGVNRMLYQLSYSPGRALSLAA